MRIVKTLVIAAVTVGGAPVPYEFHPALFSVSGAAEAKEKKAKKPKKARPAKSNRSNGGQGAGSASAGAPGQAKPANVHAQLKGLNSLNRNVNGLMNSSDPKMDGFRAFVAASADYEAAKGDLAAAHETYDPLAADYQATLAGIGLPMPTTEGEFLLLEQVLASLASAPMPNPGDYLMDDGVTPDNDAYHAALESWQQTTTGAQMALDDFDTVHEAFVAVDSAQMQVDDASVNVSEGAMIEAMLTGLNATGAGPVTADDLTPEMIDWVRERLGVDEADGLIDAYLQVLASEAQTTAAGEGLDQVAL